jgi:hypothetical protein
VQRPTITTPADRDSYGPDPRQMPNQGKCCLRRTPMVDATADKHRRHSREGQEASRPRVERERPGTGPPSPILR